MSEQFSSCNNEAFVSKLCHGKKIPQPPLIRGNFTPEICLRESTRNLSKLSINYQ